MTLRTSLFRNILQEGREISYGSSPYGNINIYLLFKYFTKLKGMSPCRVDVSVALNETVMYQTVDIFIFLEEEYINCLIISIASGSLLCIVLFSWTYDQQVIQST